MAWRGSSRRGWAETLRSAIDVAGSFRMVIGLDGAWRDNCSWRDIILSSVGSICRLFRSMTGVIFGRAKLEQTNQYSPFWI